MILLINPPNPPGCVSNKDTMGGFGQIYDNQSASSLHPLDILYIGAVLKKNDIPVKIYDCGAMHLSTDELVNIVKTTHPEILGVRTSTPTSDWDLSIIEKIKAECNTQIIVFGPHATLFAKEIIANKAVDAVILGEPEYAFLDVIMNEHWENIEGIIYKQDGKIYENTSARIVENLDSLPFPAWDMIPLDVYSPGEYISNQFPFFTILTSRGCPFGCKYCPYPIAQGNKWRARSADNVVDEIQYLINNFGMKGLLFRDPEFTLDNVRIAKICQGIIDRRIKFSWRCETRVDTVNDQLLTLMTSAGCMGINFGIESASEKVLAGVGRKSIPEKDIINRIATCKRLGIDTFCFFIIGFPDDDAETIIDTINFSLKLAPNSAQFTVFTPYYGTELRSWYVENGFIENDALSSMTSYKSVIRTKKLTSVELQKFRDLASVAWEADVKKKEHAAKVKALEEHLAAVEKRLSAKEEHLAAITNTHWYKLSYRCYTIWKKIKNLSVNH